MKSHRIACCTADYFLGCPTPYMQVLIWKEMSEVDMKNGVTTAFNEMWEMNDKLQFDDFGAEKIIERWGADILSAAGELEATAEDEVNDVYFYIAVKPEGE